MDLSILGLNTYESKAYETLIEHAEATAADISQHSGVPYGRIYDVLASLEQKGLVRVLPTSTKRYTPASPERLHELLREKQSELSSLTEHLDSLTKQYDRHDHQVVEIARGHKNFFRILKQIPASKKFDYAIKHTSKYHAEWVRETKQELARGVDRKVLARYDEQTSSDVKKWLRVDENQRVFDNKGVALSITDQGVMFALIKNNTTLFIRDEALTDVMKRLFEAAYDKAPPVPDEPGAAS